MERKETTKYDRIYRMVKSIPKGRVATYGQISSLAGLYGQARLVGYALAALPDGSSVPWHRVINSKGLVSKRGEPHSENLQRLMLESEGVLFDDLGKVSLDLFLWKPEDKGK
jgi:methylated-DNA-protein-cysteine methyltransferase-like protein